MPRVPKSWKTPHDMDFFNSSWEIWCHIVIVSVVFSVKNESMTQSQIIFLSRRGFLHPLSIFMAKKKIYIIRSEGANYFILFLFKRIIFAFVCVAWALVHSHFPRLLTLSCAYYILFLKIKLATAFHFIPSELHQLFWVPCSGVQRSA